MKSQGVTSTAKTVAVTGAVGVVDGVLDPVRALYKDDYGAFAESLPNFGATVWGGRAIKPSPKPIEYITLYHATSKDNAMMIRNNGIDLTYSKPNNDFGRGFYTTSSYDDAVQSAKMMHSLDDIDVIKFKIPKEMYNDLNRLEFHTPNNEWRDFVIHNKEFTKYLGPEGQSVSLYRPPEQWLPNIGNYDVISGPLYRRINSSGEMLHWEQRQNQVAVRSAYGVRLFDQYMLDR